MVIINPKKNHWMTRTYYIMVIPYNMVIINPEWNHWVVLAPII